MKIRFYGEEEQAQVVSRHLLLDLPATALLQCAESLDDAAAVAVVDIPERYADAAALLAWRVFTGHDLCAVRMELDWEWPPDDDAGDLR